MVIDLMIPGDNAEFDFQCTDMLLINLAQVTLAPIHKAVRFIVVSTEAEFDVEARAELELF